MFNRNLLIAAGLALTVAASFGQGTFHEDARDVQQDARIRVGEANGTITPHEADDLKAQQRDIRAAGRHARADGNPPAELEHIRHLQDHASASIQREKTNGHVD